MLGEWRGGGVKGLTANRVRVPQKGGRLASVCVEKRERGKAHLCPIAVALRVTVPGRAPPGQMRGPPWNIRPQFPPSPPFAAALLAQGQYDLDDPAYPEPPYAPYEIGEYQQGSGARLDPARRVDPPLPPALLHF